MKDTASKAIRKGCAAYVLQLCEDVLADAVLIEFGPNTRDNIVNDGAVNGRLISGT